MSPIQDVKREFPQLAGRHGQSVVIRPLRAEDRHALLAFAEALAADDLLFLQRDISQPAEVEAWIADNAVGRLTTLVACDGEAIVGFATYERGRARWMQHVAELRVVVAESARGIGIGRRMLQLAFEMATDAGATKIIARVARDQLDAQRLFEQLGFEQEAVLQDHALGEDGRTRDLLVLAFQPHKRQEQICEHCGVPVLNALVVDGARLCSHCYEAKYQELGGGD
jgi:L-amino acid N-acyltransferase YncA